MTTETGIVICEVALVLLGIAIGALGIWAVFFSDDVFDWLNGE